MIKVMSMMMMRLVMVMMIMTTVMMMFTDDQEALDCLDRDGEAESDEEDCVDERSHHLKSIRQHSFQIG